MPRRTRRDRLIEDALADYQAYMYRTLTNLLLDFPWAEGLSIGERKAFARELARDMRTAPGVPSRGPF